MFIMSVKKEHNHIYRAIELWVKTMLILCDENSNISHANDYSYFITNPDSVDHVKHVIEDFYDYFYTNQHICDINHMRTLGAVDNNYGLYEHKLRILDILKKIENNEQSKNVFQQITIYVFQLCCSERKDLGLHIFEDTEKDKSIVYYFTRME